MKRLPALAFCAMVAATIFAFFLTQVLKTADPLIWGNPKPIPAAFNPVAGRVCQSKTHHPLNYRHTTLSVVTPRTGAVGVYVVDNAGNPVATISQGRLLTLNKPSVFVWKGFENGGTFAPDGTYFFKLVLVNQGRSILLSESPITVMTHDPRAPATSVALTTLDAGPPARTGGAAAKATGPPILTPPAGSVTIHFKGGAYRRLWVDVYRSDAAGRLTRVYRFRVKPTQDTTVWRGNLAGGVPAPAGTYLFGVSVEDPACNPGRYPVTLAPPAGTTPAAGVTVRYLAAIPPLAPTVAGSRATVQVDSPTGAYSWALRLAGRGRVLARGQGSPSATSGEGTLKVRLPKHNVGLYTLTLSAGQYSTAVPLVASATGARAAPARPRVLVVLPMLTWQGQNAVDDTGDGLPATLGAGDQISLQRPLAQGLPPGFQQDSALITYLSGQHDRYQLTTDVALAQGRGPSLRGDSGVVLAGSERWLPRSLVSVLTRFVRGGGNVLSLGAGSLVGSSRISHYPSQPVASAPTRLAAGLFGAKVPVTGITGGAPAVTASRLAKGYLLTISLADFNSSLATATDSQDLLSRIWQLLDS